MRVVTYLRQQWKLDTLKISQGYIDQGNKSVTGENKCPNKHYHPVYRSFRLHSVGSLHDMHSRNCHGCSHRYLHNH